MDRRAMRPIISGYHALPMVMPMAIHRIVCQMIRCYAVVNGGHHHRHENPLDRVIHLICEKVREIERDTVRCARFNTFLKLRLNEIEQNKNY